MACFWHYKTLNLSCNWLIESPKVVFCAIGLITMEMNTYCCFILTLYFSSSPLQASSLLSREGSVRISKQQQGRVQRAQAKGEGNKNVSENLKTAQIRICQNKALVHTNKKGPYSLGPDKARPFFFTLLFFMGFFLLLFLAQL